MYTAISAVGVDQQPRPGHNFALALFFIAFIVFGGEGPVACGAMHESRLQAERERLTQVAWGHQLSHQCAHAHHTPQKQRHECGACGMVLEQCCPCALRCRRVVCGCCTYGVATHGSVLAACLSAAYRFLCPAAVCVCDD
jgi:hypothetical protein